MLRRVPIYAAGAALAAMLTPQHTMAQVLRPDGCELFAAIPGTAGYQAPDPSFSVCDSLTELANHWLEVTDDLPDPSLPRLTDIPKLIPDDSDAVLRGGRWRADLEQSMTADYLKATNGSTNVAAKLPASIAERTSLVAFNGLLPMPPPGTELFTASNSELPLAPLASPEPGSAIIAASFTAVGWLLLRRRRLAEE